MKRNSLSVARRPLVGRLAEVGLEQLRLLVVVELVVHGEVAEVEPAVAHARVLPVDQLDASSPSRRKFAVRRSLCAGTGSWSSWPLIAFSIRARPRARRRSPRAARCRWRGRSRRTPRRAGTSRTPVGSSVPESWNLRRSRATSASVSGSRSSSTRHLAPGDEQGHEAGRLLEHRRDARARCRAWRRPCSRCTRRCGRSRGSRCACPAGAPRSPCRRSSRGSCGS